MFPIWLSIWFPIDEKKKKKKEWARTPNTRFKRFLHAVVEIMQIQTAAVQKINDK